MRPRFGSSDTKNAGFTEKDTLFGKFEVNREPFWPRISWLIAGPGRGPGV